MAKLAENLKFALDPVEWARTVLEFEPDEQQTAILASNSKRILLNCCRQWGKSTTTAARAVHQAIYVPGSMVVAVSPTLRQTAELLRKMADILERAGTWAGADEFNPVSLRLENGSRIVGVPAVESSVRGFSSVDLLIVDEASRVRDELYRALRPMMAVPRNGRPGTLMLLSTPFGQRGFFWQIWDKKDRPGLEETWLRVQVKATQCPRISEEFLREEYHALGEHWYKQEYLCVFHEPEGRLFSDELIQRALDPNLEWLFDNDGIYTKPEENDWLWKGEVEVNRRLWPEGPLVPVRVK